MQELAKQFITIMKIDQSFIDRVSELLNAKVDYGFILGGDFNPSAFVASGIGYSKCWYQLGVVRGELILSDFESPELLAEHVLSQLKIQPASTSETMDEKPLVSFGNYLFHRYDVQVFSNDGQNVPLYGRQVTDADIQNWKVGYALDWVPNKLPSRFQNGDKVQVNYGLSGIIKNCEVIKVHFVDKKSSGKEDDFKGKVLYDVSVKIPNPPDMKGLDSYTRLYNIDSEFVKPAE